MTPAYIALGSNLRCPETQLRRAVAALATLPQAQLTRVSPVYRSPAVGPGEQPDYLNAVALLNTGLPAETLLDALQQIENAQGRVREIHWGARTLDLDILLYGQDCIESNRLSIPHPAMSRRNFVLYPLVDLAGINLQLPDGTVLGTLVAACARGGLEKTAIDLNNNETATGNTRGITP
jgi:2-amino-4-hydroxy-6-hydroxymethyldihydropteridine diphosphokinase